jgi:arylsulfatase A
MRSIAFLSASLLAVSQAARDPKNKPNIIMFFVDDLGYGDTGFNGHPTAETPNIDTLAYGGKKLTNWYSGCPVCSGSRAALMTGRQWQRVGVPGVFGNAVSTGLPLNETTVAEHLKTAGYATAAVGKWHLGQRHAYLPHNRGFDHYLGIPFSDDMGQGRATACSNPESGVPCMEGLTDEEWGKSQYAALGYLSEDDVAANNGDDPGAAWTPLVHQTNGKTTVLEQPVDFTFLAEKYNNFAGDFIKNHTSDPFFLYMPFSHVHTTAGNMPEKQYAGCQWKNTSRRGPFGDALSEVDWIIGNVHQAVKDAGIEENTLMLFTGDNGPWMIQGLSGGSTGLLTGRYSGYWNTGKGSTWEGGIREAAFAYWKGQIQPHTRTSEVVSSLDLFPTVSALAGVQLPADRVYDGKDMSDVILQAKGKSKHDFLFFYGGCGGHAKPSSVRHGKWKAHWCTGPGLGGQDKKITYDTPLLFNVEKDPSEAEPVSTDKGEGKTVVEEIMAAYANEVATFTTQNLIAEPDEEGEGPGHYAVCCDVSQNCKCDGETLV